MCLCKLQAKFQLKLLLHPLQLKKVVQQNRLIQLLDKKLKQQQQPALLTLHKINQSTIK